MVRVSLQLDEGYSEDTRSMIGSDTSMTMLSDGVYEDARVRAMELSLAERADLIFELSCTLPTSLIAKNAKQLEHRLHLDPIYYLPVELMLQVFSYLTTQDLLECSSVSRRWRERTTDEKLWRNLFWREGWCTDDLKMRAFEELESERRLRNVKEHPEPSAQASRVRKPEGELERRGSRKRQRATSIQVNGWVEQHGRVEADADSSSDGEDGMPGIKVEEADVEDVDLAGASISAGLRRDSASKTSSSSSSSLSEDELTPATFPLVRPALFTRHSRHTLEPKFSWSYLYKQRRRLERNWDKGKYRMLQLPHPNHPDDGHAECVYTIQHSGQHLVSGSRDHTIRIWNLDTLRLARAPLRGHKASVLCLQFDERPQQDIIVSGGSDTFVIIWKFSTGEIVKKMTTAHEESVLNLRFDDRYIVTCSKDKTIKIWNRQALQLDDPLVPIGALNWCASDVNEDDLIAEHSLVKVLSGHNAAVNAVQIHGNTIVSASGDRTIRSWNIKTGDSDRTYNGHTKGIACVQYDGRRIVSGSSDNTVRIFDSSAGAEVACLAGHHNLVRTIQARFGDLEDPIEELEEQARAADDRFFSALDSGKLRLASASRSARRNAGSSRPEDMLAFGTKIPPGGGGSRWARIVSGSYDETVILWKKDRDGNWQVSARLYQDILPGARSRRHQPPPNPPPPFTQAQLTAMGNQQANQLLLHSQGQLNGPQTQYLQQTMLQQAQQHHLQHTNQTGQNVQPVPGPAGQQAQGTPAQPNLSVQQMAQVHAAALAQVANQAGPANNVAAQPAQAAQPLQQQAPAAPPANGNGQPAAAVPGPQLTQAQIQQLAAHQAGVPRDSNRVFKLQFDARRIVCCSQNKVIVGWDFAAGDRELERVSAFFVETA